MKVPKLFIVAALALLALAALAGCGGSEGIPLQYKYQAGDSFTYDLDLTMNGEVSGPGIPADQEALPADTSISMRLHMSVEEVVDGVATVAYGYESLEMSAAGQAVPVPLQDMPELKMKVDETGKVLSIEGLENALPPGFSMSQLPFDPSQFAGQTNIVYPQGGFAQPGDTWEATSSAPIPGAGQVDSRSTGELLSVTDEGGIQVAEVAFTVDTPLDLTLDLAEMMKEMGLDQLMGAALPTEDLRFKITMKGEQNVEGISRVDVSNGMPVDMSADMNIGLDMEVIDAPAEVVPEDQRGPISINMQAELTLTQVK